MKRTICILLLAVMCLALCACGGSGYGVKTIQTLVEQEYSLAFRNDDPLYYYVTAALQSLGAEGQIDSLAQKWFGSTIIEMDKKEGALESIAAPEPQTFIIGIDTNSFPMAYVSNGEYWGFDVELAKLVCGRLGWTLKIQPIEKENVYVELYSGNIDCAWGGIALDQTELDEQKYTQYGPYVKNDIVVAARINSNIWNKLKLNGKNMAMCTTTEALAALESDGRLSKRLGQITRLAGGTVECFDYLYTGKCDAVLTDSTALYYYNCH